MLFTIQKKDFFDIIQKAYPIVPTKTSLQVLLNFKFKFNPQSLEIVSTDLDQSIRLKSPINGGGDEGYEIILNAKKILKIAKDFHDGELILRIDENVLTIESGGSFTCKISGVDSQDFPEFPDIQDFNQVEISQSELRSLIIKSSFAVSKNEATKSLCGVFFEVSGNKISMVSTDGQRLGNSFIESRYSIDSQISGIIPQKSLLHLSRIIDSNGSSGNIYVKFSDKYVMFSTDDYTICSKLINEVYPNYKAIIPSTNTNVIEIDKMELIEAVKKLDKYTNSKSHLVEFKLEINKLTVFVSNRKNGIEISQVIDKIKIKGKLNQFTIRINAKYFIEILDKIETNAVILKINNLYSKMPIMILPNKGNDLFLLMPLKI